MGYYIVTGATSGIGEGCVRRFAEKGHYVVAIGRNKDKLRELSEQLGDKLIPVEYDLIDLSNIDNIYNICRQQAVRFDGMVYSAGMDNMSPVKVNSIQKMRTTMDVNCFAFAEMGRLFYSKRYSNNGASIVAVSSMASLVNDIGMMAYSASKAALNSVVKTMAKEFVGREIRVNAILPGGVDTPMAREKNRVLMKSDEQIEKGQPLGLIHVEHIVDEIEYLLSPKAHFMTGELITISGGMRY